jgi:hypothetical protein
MPLSTYSTLVATGRHTCPALLHAGYIKWQPAFKIKIHRCWAGCWKRAAQLPRATFLRAAHKHRINGRIVWASVENVLMAAGLP